MNKPAKHELLLIAAALLIAAVLCVFKTIDSPKYSPSQAVSVTLTHTSAKQETSLVNINTATLSELATLEGIGEKKAQAIIDYRTEKGSFRSIDELAQVEGIGETLVEENRSRITL